MDKTLFRRYLGVDYLDWMILAINKLSFLSTTKFFF